MDQAVGGMRVGVGRDGRIVLRRRSHAMTTLHAIWRGQRAAWAGWMRREGKLISTTEADDARVAGACAEDAVLLDQSEIGKPAHTPGV